MAFNEGLKQRIDMLGALQARRQMEESQKSRAMQEQLMAEQVEATKNANRESQMKYDYLTSPFNIPREHWAGSGNANTPGLDKYISDNQAMQKLSMLTGQNMPNQGISGYGGGGREPQAVSPDAERLLGAQADFAEEQARIAQQQRQGRGSATRDLLAEQMVNAKMGGLNDRGYDDLIKDARGASKDRWQDIRMGDQAIAGTKALGNEMQSEIEETRGREFDASIESLRNEIYNDNAYTSIKDSKIKKSIVDGVGNLKMELNARNITPGTPKYRAAILAYINEVKESIKPTE